MKPMRFTVNHNKEINRLFVDSSSYMRAYVHVRGQISVNSNYICESR